MKFRKALISGISCLLILAIGALCPAAPAPHYAHIKALRVPVAEDHYDRMKGLCVRDITIGLGGDSQEDIRHYLYSLAVIHNSLNECFRRFQPSQASLINSATKAVILAIEKGVSGIDVDAFIRKLVDIDMFLLAAEVCVAVVENDVEGIDIDGFMRVFADAGREDFVDAIKQSVEDKKNNVGKKESAKESAIDEYERESLKIDFDKIDINKEFARLIKKGDFSNSSDLVIGAIRSGRSDIDIEYAVNEYSFHRRFDLIEKIMDEASKSAIDYIDIEKVMSRFSKSERPDVAIKIAVNYLVNKYSPLMDKDSGFAYGLNETIKYCAKNDLRLVPMNKLVLERTMETNLEEFYSKKSLLDKLETIFIENKRESFRHRKNEVLWFKDNYLPLAYILETIVPGSIKTITDVAIKTRSHSAVIRFLDSKRNAILDEEVSAELISVLDKMRVYKVTYSRKRFKPDIEKMHKIINASNAFMVVNAKDSLMAILKDFEGSHSLDDLYRAMETAFLENLSRHLGIKEFSVHAEVYDRLYIPFVPRLSSAIGRIEIEGVDKSKVATAVFKATFEDRFWDLIENTEQKDHIGEDIALHNRNVRSKIKSIGIDVDKWLGKEPDKRMPERGFRLLMEGAKESKSFILRPIARNPGRDLFLGDFTDCCIGMASGESPYAMIERLIDEGINTIEVVDPSTEETIACSWLYIDEEGDLVIQNLELDADYRNTGPPKTVIAEEMIDYAEHFARYIGAKRLYIGIPDDGPYFDEGGFVKTRYKEKLVPFMKDKIGGYLYGERYYLVSAGKPEAYLVKDFLKDRPLDPALLKQRDINSGT